MNPGSRSRVDVTWAALACSGMLCGAVPAQLPPLAVSADGRQLIKGDVPFFWIADTAWYLYRLDPAELDQYLANRRAKGFNVIQGPILHDEHENYAGHSNPDFANPNESWFAHIDLIVSRAAAHGLYIAPVLTWGTHIEAFTPESAFAYGQYVGDRYRTHSNIACFIVAGEFNHVSNDATIWSAMAQGLEAGLDGTQRMMTCHPRACCVWGGQSTGDALHNEPWLSFNMVQSAHYGDCTNDPSHLYYLGVHNWILIQNDWNRTPVKPTFDGEGGYEDIPTTNPSCPNNPSRWPTFGVRRRAYWSVFAGGFGYTYGANGVFQFNKIDDPITEWDPNFFWEEAMELPGSAQMGRLRRLMQSRPMAGRMGDQSLLLAGATENVPGHLHAMRAGAAPAMASSFAMVYVPKNNKSFTIDMDLLSGEAHRFWWFVPATGIATLIGEYTRGDYAGNGGFALTTPAAGEDFVLVIDDLSAGFAAPGSSPLWTPGDATVDDHVDVNDLLHVISTWGPCPAAPAPCLADVAPPEAGDDIVDVNDLLAVITNWGA